MKPWIVISLLGTFTAVAKPPMRDVVTHDELALKYRKAAQEDPMGKLIAAQAAAQASVKAADPGKKIVPAKPTTPETPAPPPSLLAQSDIICYNGAATVVPKRAIIQIPKNLTSRLTYEAGAKLMNWSDFYAQNRAWITLVEVSEAQAEGSSPLTEDTQKQIVKSGKLMIATYHGGPISVLPLKVPPEEVKTPTSESKL